MKAKLFTILAILCMMFGTVACHKKDKSRDHAIESAYGSGSGTYYICTGPSAYSYHTNPDCRGLNRCSALIRKVSLSEAEEMGRSACGICY